MFKGEVLITLVDTVDKAPFPRSDGNCACEQSVAECDTEFHHLVDTQCHAFYSPQSDVHLSAVDHQIFHSLIHTCGNQVLTAPAGFA